MSADLLSDPPTGSVREQHPGCGDPGAFECPRHHRAQGVVTRQAVLVPHQACRPPEARQINKRDLRTSAYTARFPTAQTLTEQTGGLDLHDQQPGFVDDAEHDDVRQADKQLAHASSV
jgi:hypothetical protein